MWFSIFFEKALVFIVPGNLVCLSMSTAIVRTYTDEGFVIAADGRAIKTEDLSLLSDQAQKIFQIPGQGGLLAYAIAGTAQITVEDSNEVVFDLAAEISKASQEL